MININTLQVRSLLTGVMMLISLMLMSAQAETELKIITLQHRFADDLLPTISPMVGLDGTATGIRNQLILRASPERMREIIVIVDQLDTARVNRKITINRSTNQDIQNSRIEANGNIQVGRVTIGNTKQTRQNTGNINIEQTTRTTQQSSSQFLNVVDGERAFIRVGQMIPFTQEWRTITRRYTQIERVTDWQEVSTGFAVRPRTIGNQVELEVTPRIARLNAQGYIDFDELSTTLRVQLGEWVDIGSTMQSHDDVSRKILGISSSYSNENNGLIIKVD